MLEVVNTILFLIFGHLIFGFVSDFGIRISNFVKSSYQIMPSGLNPKPGSLDKVCLYLINIDYRHVTSLLW